jgi:hypothetical protein
LQWSLLAILRCWFDLEIWRRKFVDPYDRGGLVRLNRATQLVVSALYTFEG